VLTTYFKEILLSQSILSGVPSLYSAATVPSSSGVHRWKPRKK